MSAPEALFVRCSRRDCRTMVDLEDDPAALCDECGEVTCDGCEHLNCEGRIVTGLRTFPVPDAAADPEAS